MRRRFTVPRGPVPTGTEANQRGVARDLHDAIGPTLAATALGLRAARNLLQKDRAAVEQILTRLESELYSAIAEIRRLADDARPPVVDRLGLVAAVRRHAEILSGRLSTARGAGGALRIEVRVDGELPYLPSAVEVAAYRIVCEALTNVAKHSNAGICTVRFWMDGDLHIEVVDDGDGAVFDGMIVEAPAGVGLGSMRERACSLGGEWAIERASPGGTRVAATLPIGTE
jgi:signal transduction histidine kinase